MYVELKGFGPNTVLNGVVKPDTNAKVVMHAVSREEFATMYFALKAYADQLEKSLNGENFDPKQEHEDKMFIYDTLHKVHGVLFEMLENFNDDDLTVIAKWSEVI